MIVMKTSPLTLGMSGVVIITAFAAWYSCAANYGYGSLAGTYIYADGKISCKLSLEKDGTFREELNGRGTTASARGGWHRYGESHVSFSSEFLTLPGEELDGAGEAHGEFEKQFGIFPRLTLAPLPDGPSLHRRLLN